jgi:hypothetical protein
VAASNSSEATEQPTTSTLKAADIALSDLLKAETRKARLYLLGVSVVSIAIVFTGLVPQEITTLGITFKQSDQQSLLSILTLVILYFLVTFITYGVSDFLYWQQAYRQASWSEMNQTFRVMMEVNEQVNAHLDDLDVKGSDLDELMRYRRVQREDVMALLEPDYGLIKWYPALSAVVAPVRAVVEFLLPLLVGLWAIYILMLPTVLQTIIAGAATVVTALVTVFAVRRSRHAPYEGLSKEAKEVEEVEEAVEEAVEKAVGKVNAGLVEEAVAQEETPEDSPPKEQPRDR